jgi:hypothetical protein
MTNPKVPDYYQVLGVPTTATTEQITARYRQLAKTHHPDRGGDPRAFQAAKTAYGTLSDPASRAQYDASRQPIYTAQVPPITVPTAPTGPPQQYHGFPSPQSPGQVDQPQVQQPWPQSVSQTPGLARTARRLRAYQYAAAALVALIWDLTRASGFANSMFGAHTTQSLPTPLRHLTGQHFKLATLAAAVATGLAIELVMGIALRVDLARPAVLRYAIGPVISAGFLIGEYLLTTRGLVVWAGVAVGATLVSFVITFARSKTAWRQEP